MGYLDKEIFICLDCEATGLDTQKDEIIEIGVIKFTFSEILETYETLVDPGCPIPQESINIHNITDEMCRGKPKIAEVLPEVLKLINKHIIVGHQISFDLNLIGAAARRLNLHCPIDAARSIDTLRLARLCAEAPTNSLEVLRKHYNIPEEGAHRALNDVKVNIQVFKYLSQRFKKTEELMNRLKSPIQLPLMPLGKYKGRPFKEVPIEFLRWAKHQKFDIDLLFSINQELKKRKNKANFSDSSNPFADL